MNYAEAKEAIKTAGTLYRACYDGQQWDAGRMIEVGGTIGYYATEQDALDACADYRLIDFDREHMTTHVEEVTADEFAD